jgi:hypothetical protein
VRARGDTMVRSIWAAFSRSVIRPSRSRTCASTGADASLYSDTPSPCAADMGGGWTCAHGLDFKRAEAAAVTGASDFLPEPRCSLPPPVSSRAMPRRAPAFPSST